VGPRSAAAVPAPISQQRLLKGVGAVAGPLGPQTVVPKPAARFVSLQLSPSPTCTAVLRPLQSRVLQRPSNPVHESIVVQIDGLVYAVFRRRLERDVLGGEGVSFCSLFGAGVSPASTFCGLYLSWPQPLTEIAAAVRDERGYGVFAGPSHDVHALGGRILLEFSFKSLLGAEWRAALMSFAFASKLRRKRPETFFALEVIEGSPICVGLLPFCPGRASTIRRTAPPDSSKSSPPLPVFDGCFPAPSPCVAWDQGIMAEWSALFPCPTIAALAAAAASPEGSDSRFAGDRSKRVLSANMPLSDARKVQVLEHLLAEKAAGRVLGPFPRPPFPNAWCDSQPRNVAIGAVPKDKWDPSSDAFRLISNCSVEKPSSVNDLVYSPRMLAFRLQAFHIRDILASKGPRPRFRAVDHRKAFRTNRSRLCDLHLSCYELNGEWFVDLYHFFGGIVPEWSYDCIGEVINWALYSLKICSEDSPTCRYVDNWFSFAARDDPSAEGRWQQCTSLLARAGVDLHEEQDIDDGVVLALGWEWRLGFFECSEDKFAVQVRFVSDWRSRSAAGLQFSANEIERLVGLLSWVSTAAPVIRPLVASIRSVLYCSRGRKRESIFLPAEAVAAIDLLFLFYGSWDRRAPISMGFTPVSSWQALVRTDASTEFGAGGFVFPRAEAFVHMWTASERTAASRHVRESTTYFELLAILIALQLLGSSLSGLRVQFECDSEPAVIALCKCYSPEKGCRDIIRSICLFCTSHHITPRWEHILGVFNTVADSLSHNNFFQAKALFAAGLGGDLPLTLCRRS
jgi:hypothetical protein